MGQHEKLCAHGRRRCQKGAGRQDDDPGNPTVDFHGEKRCNDTHQSTTDPESVLYRKAKGKEAKLCFGGHILMENRNGLCADFAIHNPIAQGEPAMALQQLDEHVRLYQGTQPKTVGADKGYHQKAFVAGAGSGTSPSCGVQGWSEVEGLDKRTTERSGCQTSLRIRKRVEEIFGWIKTVEDSGARL